MKKIKILVFLLLSALGLGCTKNDSVLKEDGESGNITLMLKLSCRLPMDTGESQAMFLPEKNGAYLRRVVVESYVGGVKTQRQESFFEPDGASEEVIMDVNMNLHPRNYSFAVWSDYVKAVDKSEVYYDTQTGGDLKHIIGKGTYAGNSEYKDVFCGRASLDLRSYEGKGKVSLTFDLVLERPVARYELVADDVQAFLSRLNKGEISGSTFTARLSYDGFFPTGYHVADGVAKHLLLLQSYQKDFKKGDLKDDSFTLAVDYPLVGDKPVAATLEILSGKNVVAETAVELSLQKGKSSTLYGHFLTITGEVAGPDEPGPDEPDEPEAIVPGMYVNKDGSCTEEFVEGQSIAIVFASAKGKTDNSAYGEGKVPVVYAFALNAVTRDKLIDSAPEAGTAVFDAALYNGEYGMAGNEAFLSAFGEGAVVTAFKGWLESNQTAAERLSEWYVPTPTMLKDMIGVMFNEDGWTFNNNNIEVVYPPKNALVTAAYDKAKGEESDFALNGTASNMLSSGYLSSRKIACVQLNQSGKTMGARDTAPTGKYTFRPVITVFAE